MSVVTKALFGLATTLEPAPAWAETNPTPPDREPAFVKTSFDRFPVELCNRLLYAGWWLTGATLRCYHTREVDGGELDGAVPAWQAPA